LRCHIDPLCEKGAVFILAVADEDDGGALAGGGVFEKIQQSGSVGIVEALGRFIEDEQFRGFDQRPGDQGQPLFGKAQGAKRYGCPVGQSNGFQPVAGGRQLGPACLSVEARWSRKTPRSPPAGRSRAPGNHGAGPG
jgi:hypothetical protein